MARAIEFHQFHPKITPRSGRSASMPAFLLLGLAAAALAAAETPGGLKVAIDPATAAFTVSVGGAQWLAGLPPTASWGNGAAAGRPLTLARHTTSAGTHPTLGAYDETRFFWTEKDTAVETAFQIFADGQTAILEQHFPRGLPQGSSRGDTGMLADGRPLLSFPDFSSASDSLGAVTWASTFSQLATSLTQRLTELRYGSVSRANGGPVVAFEADSYRSLVISPYDHFLASTSYITPPPPPPPLACGIKGGAPACSVREATDVTGRKGAPKKDLGSFPNLTRTECCNKCTANPKCEAWARGKEGSTAGSPGLAPPGAVAHCWLVGGVVGTEASVGREVGCPTRNSSSTEAAAAAPSSARSWWSHGVSGAVESLPAGFTHSTVLSAGGLGITAGLQKWGTTMYKAHNVTTVARRQPDIGVSHLSYWTDNGARKRFLEQFYATKDRFAKTGSGQT
jgi:hypothetical protein